MPTKCLARLWEMGWVLGGCPQGAAQEWLSPAGRSLLQVTQEQLSPTGGAQKAGQGGLEFWGAWARPEGLPGVEGLPGALSEASASFRPPL